MKRGVTGVAINGTRLEENNFPLDGIVNNENHNVLEKLAVGAAPDRTIALVMPMNPRRPARLLVLWPRTRAEMSEVRCQCAANGAHCLQ